jgi:glutamine synthetase
MTTDNGVNLLDPGKTPHENIQFLLVLGCIMKAVDTHADLLRESASNVGNDHRLGANEAPPAIISMFLGEQLEDVVMQLIDKGDATSSIQKGKLKTGVKSLPDLAKDATDRNRTSPFAFTGNKFEFRMVGSADSIAPANVVLNTIVAESFKEVCDELEKAENLDMAIHDKIKELFTKYHRIVFNGNGYSDEWVAEAEKRGLPNIRNMVDAVSALTTDKAVKLFEEFGVFTKTELESRSEIKYEAYSKAINIEAKTMLDMAAKQIVPAVVSYSTEVANSALAVAEVGCDNSVQKELLTDISTELKAVKEAQAKLSEAVCKAAMIEAAKEQAVFYRDVVKTAMDELRKPADKLEMLVDEEYWPFPQYEDLIFEV